MNFESIVKSIRICSDMHIKIKIGNRKNMNIQTEYQRWIIFIEHKKTITYLFISQRGNSTIQKSRLNNVANYVKVKLRPATCFFFFFFFRHPHNYRYRCCCCCSNCFRAFEFVSTNRQSEREKNIVTITVPIQHECCIRNICSRKPIS